VDKSTTYSVEGKCWVNAVLNGIELEVKQRVVESYREYCESGAGEHGKSDGKEIVPYRRDCIWLVAGKFAKNLAEMQGLLRRRKSCAHQEAGD
jgi:hypothetical protein